MQSSHYIIIKNRTDIIILHIGEERGVTNVGKRMTWHVVPQEPVHDFELCNGMP